MSFSRVLSSLLLATVSVREALAGQHITPHRAEHKARAQQLNQRQSSTNYTLFDSAEGQSFFDKWNFDTFADPTHGLVTYVDSGTAFSQGLAYVRDDGVAVMRVDNTTQLQDGQNRNSVRISSKTAYGQGLFIADILQMPYGCSVWPAFWSNGDNWPAGGEIDVIEGTQNSTSNQSTLHTLPGCTLDTSVQNDNNQSGDNTTFTGVVQTTVCDASVDFNSGCGIQDPNPNSYGFGLNLAGGGVYATLWDENGIKIWFFPRVSIPEDITNQTPDPDSWGTPTAFFSPSSCPMSQFFTNQTFIFNITLCGDLANATFGQGGCPGTCSQFVADPTNFRTAMWKVNYFRVYQTQSQ